MRRFSSAENISKWWLTPDSRFLKLDCGFTKSESELWTAATISTLDRLHTCTDRSCEVYCCIELKWEDNRHVTNASSRLIKTGKMYIHLDDFAQIRWFFRHWVGTGYACCFSCVLPIFHCVFLGSGKMFTICHRTRFIQSVPQTSFFFTTTIHIKYNYSIRIDDCWVS